MVLAPKILIFTPIYEGKDYCLDTFLEHARNIDYPNSRHIIIDNSKDDSYYKYLKTKVDKEEVYRVERGNNSRETLARTQNFARRIALNEGYHFLFSLESDVMVPRDTIKGLLISGKSVISGLYFIGDRNKGVRVPCITVRKWNDQIGAYGSRLLAPEEFYDYLNQGIKHVHAAGMGCCLMHRSVFAQFPFTYDYRYKGHSDIYFFNDCFRRGIPVFVHTDIVCDHQNSKWEDVEDR